MDDKELIELCAKAVGVELANEPFMHAFKSGALKKSGGIFYPLNSNDQVFKIALILQIDICHEENETHTVLNRQIRHVNIWPMDGFRGISVDLDDPDMLTKVRRAIVTQAAKIAQRTA